MIKILLIDDHAIIRKGLKMYIKKMIPHAETDEAVDGDSAFIKIKQHDYKLIVLDVNMPGTDSSSLMTNILAVKPQANILIFSMNAEEGYARRYLQLGAKGYISKTAEPDEIGVAITTVLANKKYISPALKMSFAEEVIDKKKKADNPFDELSPREFEIVQHMIKGESPAEICNQLNLHSSTVATHKARIFQKLNCKNVLDIIALAKLYHVTTVF